MSISSDSTTEIEEERLRKVKELITELGQNWTAGFEPGFQGCHELLDRTNLVADNIEQYVLAHPACIQNPEWYALAEQAVAALRDLYQRIGADHLGQSE
jgi:hypothetical protein